MLSFITVLSLMYVMIRIMLYYKSMQHNATAIYGEDSYYKYYPTVLYSILPCVATAAFEPIAEALNKFEGHTTKVMRCLEMVLNWCKAFNKLYRFCETNRRTLRIRAL